MIGLAKKGAKVHSLYFFANGNVGACDASGKQVVEAQKGNAFLCKIKSLQRRNMLAKDCKVRMSGWGDGAYTTEELK